MQKRVQLLSSGIEECQMLKLKIEHQSECGAGDAQVDNINQSLVNSYSEGIQKVYLRVLRCQ